MGNSIGRSRAVGHLGTASLADYAYVAQAFFEFWGWSNDPDDLDFSYQLVKAFLAELSPREWLAPRGQFVIEGCRVERDVA